MGNILFSVITPVYNRMDCIKRCLNSLAKQEHLSYEMIVIDDGSTDSTLQEIELNRLSVKNLNLITYTQNRGVNYARNRGIEAAKGKYIIFLDSDDMLKDNALQTIAEGIKNNPGFSHYLFGVSDRIDDNTLPSTITGFTYQDWLSGRVTGDFAHVIMPDCFNQLMFVEDFRIYESLNWLRVLRANEKQLFIPDIVVERERYRADSVTRESILNNRISILNNYNYLYQFIDWYGDELKEYSLSSILQENIQKALLLGIALKENLRNNLLFKKLDNPSLLFKLLNLLNKRMFSFVFFRLIQLKSTLNQTILK